MSDSPNKTQFPHIPFTHTKLNQDESQNNAHSFFNKMNQRRSLRFFSADPISLGLVENLIRTAGTAPSGAHQQPWTFVVVQDPAIKKKIRLAAEEEEKKSYEGRMADEWLEALAPLGTDWRKPFLEVAPYLIVVFRQRYGTKPDGSKKTHYYSAESVGIAVGFLIAAIHNAGLVTLTHTPSPMNFLKNLLGRPENEVPFVLLPVGYPADNATVPDLSRKELNQIMIVK